MEIVSQLEMASTSAPDSSCNSNRYDVFLSFRGEDTRHNFTDHLYTALIRRGIKVFRDDKLVRGDEIQQELLKAIEGSRSSIVVFSKTYADSRWCLEELAKIMECRQELGQIVLPIFYHVDPSDLRNRRGRFGEAFGRHVQKWNNEKKQLVERWREAFTEAASVAGWHVNDGYESEYIKEISTTILKRLNYKCLYVGENLVGMEFYLRELTLKLKIHSNDDVRIVGIYGIGGIGKTTVAKAIYNRFALEFDCSSFLENVKGIHKDKGLHDLQNQLLHDITGEKHDISNISQGAHEIQNTLRCRKALIVFDDIEDNLKQLEYLVGKHHWFGRGSRVLITTRDQHLLDQADDICEIEELNSEDALKLFSLCAFRKGLPEEDHRILSNDVVCYCQGLPLALKVLGSLLRGKQTSEWESEVHKLKKKPKAEIQDVLKISYDGLDTTQQAIFLDIACFFKGEDRVFVSKILDGCEMHAESGIGVLKARCLITFSHDNKIFMHDLIQQMGWEIVREQHPKDPSKWTRLWNPDDIYRAFTSKKRMKNIETISLDLSRSDELWFNRVVFAELKKIFANMMELRLLKVYCSNSLIRNKYGTTLPEGFEFPVGLKYLYWEGLESLPSKFDAMNLVAINLRCSNIKKLWKGKKHHENLKFIDVSDSQQLSKMPNFSSMPNLESLNVGGCKSFNKLHSCIPVFPHMKLLKELCLSGTGIEEVPSSIGSLTSLRILDLSRCSKIQKFPDIFANMRCLRKLYMCEINIKELPCSIRYLESLETISLNYCSKFEKFPEIYGNMKCLKELLLKGTAIKDLPTSIGYSESLEIISLNDCSKFEKFPEIQGNMKCLKKLYLEGTAIKELPNSIGCLESLEVISLQSCSNFEKFPEIQGNMKCLENIYLQYTAIKELPDSIGCLKALRELDVRGCTNLEKFPEIQRNMESLSNLFIFGAAIKELPCSIGHLNGLRALQLEKCKSLKSLPGSMCGLKYLQYLSLRGCSNLNLEGFWEIIEEMEHLEDLDLCGITAITEAPSSIERLKDLRSLRLSNCENLVILPNSMGSLTCLRSLFLDHCPKLHKFPDSLTGLQFCLKELDISGCNLMEGEIPSDLWCLFSIKYLNLSENQIHCIPTGITQLSKLKRLVMNHCPMLEEIPEFPSSLRIIQAFGCPCLHALSCDSVPTHLLWSSLLNSFRLQTQNLKSKRNMYYRGLDGIKIVVPAGSGIPNWVRDQSRGCEVRIELPKTWYKDDNFLGFALFFHFVPPDGNGNFLDSPYWEFSISQDGDQFMRVNDFLFQNTLYDGQGLVGLGVSFFPQIGILNEYRSRRWNTFKAFMKGYSGRIERCGIHLIYAQVQDDHHLIKRSRSNNHPEEEEDLHQKRSRHHL